MDFTFSEIDGGGAISPFAIVSVSIYRKDVLLQ